jgi:hypothetical protein
VGEGNLNSMMTMQHYLRGVPQGLFNIESSVSGCKCKAGLLDGESHFDDFAKDVWCRGDRS